MDAYVYRGALYCENCAEEIKVTLSEPVHRDDSGEWPQGPYPNGGGEADTMQHCDGCNRFLENRLTGDGVEYALNAVRCYVWEQRGNIETLRQWVKHLESMSANWTLIDDANKLFYAFHAIDARNECEPF